MPSQSAERIFEAATRLFGERGYPSTSMRDIGEEVGLLAGSLYSHISSKEAVLLAIVETGLDRYLAALAPIVESDAPADVRMRQAIKAHVDLVAHHVEESLVALRQWKFLSGENRTRIETKRHAGSDAFARILTDGIESGVFKAVPNPHITIAGILGTLNSVPDWYSPKGSATPEEIGEQLADLLLGGLVTPARSTRTAPGARSNSKPARGTRR